LCPGEKPGYGAKHGKSPAERRHVADVTATPVRRWKPDDNPFEECKSLVQVLAKKTETLCRECRSDMDKATHIRTMGSTLATPD